MKSEVAQAASAIKAELKAAYPTIKFSVKSRSFSMGDAVDISYQDGPLSKNVDKIVGKYQYGHFDGMQDLYEHDNNIDGLPQSKYVHVNREISPETRLAIADELGIAHDEIGNNNPERGGYNYTLIWRVFQQREFGVEPATEQVFADELPIFQETAQAESDAITKTNEPVVESVETCCLAALEALSQTSIFGADIEVAKKYIRQALELQKPTLRIIKTINDVSK